MTSAALELIHQHASARQYKPDPIPEEVIETIVAAGQRASSSSNLQSYSVVAVTDPARRARLAGLCGNQEHIRTAPLFLAWCADLARLRRVCELRGQAQASGFVENLLVATIDAALAAQTAALAAEALGLGICYIGSIRQDPAAVIELLALPHLVFPLTGMTVGWPADEPAPLPRLPLKAVLHRERYDASCQDESLRSYDRAMIATGIYKNRQVAVPGQDGEFEDYGWLESAARRGAKMDRTGLRAVLEKQGFGLK